MSSERDPLSRTLRGIGGPDEMVRIPDDPASYPSPTPPPAAFPEIEQVTEAGGPELVHGPWSAVTIWTQRRVYALDAQLVCRAVLDRQSFLPQPNHPVLGCTLAFGQRRDAHGAIVQVTRPYPEPGTNAIFSQRVGNAHRWSETSPVARVVLRQHRVDLVPRRS